jgi:hypothetical protein
MKWPHIAHLKIKIKSLFFLYYFPIIISVPLGLLVMCGYSHRYYSLLLLITSPLYLTLCIPFFLLFPPSSHFPPYYFLFLFRAIGDEFLKPYITSHPEILEREIRPEDEYLVLASDEIWA